MAFWPLCQVLNAQALVIENQNDKLSNTLGTLFNIRLSGRITDARTGEALPGASILIADQKLGTAANNEGYYLFANVPDGHHVIEVSHSGYATIVEHIQLNTDIQKDFALHPVITENQAVIVTGVTAATSIRKAPIPVTLLRKNALLQSASSNIIDALGKIPGIAQLSTGPAASKPIIRGLGYNRVVTINDGLRQEGQQWGDEHGIEIDEYSVQRVEVLKGPASLMYGSDAMAGVVNFITNVPVAEGSFKGNLQTNYQTNSGLLGLHGNFAGNKKGFNWNLFGSYKNAGDYENAMDGLVLNSRFNEKNVGGYAGINKSWGFSHLIFSRFDQKAGLIEGDRDAATGRFLLYAGSPIERIATRDDLESRKVFVPFQHIRHTRIVSDNNFSIGRNRLKLNAGYQVNHRIEFGNPEQPQEKELFFDLRTFNYNLQWQLPEINEWHTAIGVNGMQQVNNNRGEEVLIPEYNLFDAGLFVYSQRFFEKWTLSGGLRVDHRSVNSKPYISGTEVKFIAFEKKFSNLSGSLGVSYEPNEKLTLKLNIARGFRAPGLAELGSNGSHEGTNRYEYGNNNLHSETSLQGDAGLEFNYEHFHFSLAAFYNRVNDFIFYRKLNSVFGGDSLVMVDNEPTPAFQFDQNNAALYGLEAVFDVHPHPFDWLHFENSLSLVRGVFDEPIDGSTNLPLIPAPKWKSELRANISKAGKRFSNLYASFEADHSFRQDKPFTGYQTETPTPSYTLLNAAAGGEIRNENRILFSLHLALTNLTDRVYQQHLSRLKYTAQNLVTGRQGVFATGRNFSVRVNIPLGK